MTFRLRWPTDYYRTTQAFGANPLYYRRFGLPAHEGIDLEAPYGSSIYTCADGVVYLVSSGGAYGNQIRIDHQNGYKTVYAHLQRALVKQGDSVVAGQLIGLANNTGNSTGSHLHLTLKKDGATASGETNYPSDIVDPTPYLYKPTANPLLRVIATVLNMRTGPGLRFAVVGTVRYNSLVEVLEPIEEVLPELGMRDTWVIVRFGALKGWCAGYWLRES